jgi:hypothetical protein
MEAILPAEFRSINIASESQMTLIKQRSTEDFARSEQNHQEMSSTLHICSMGTKD